MKQFKLINLYYKDLKIDRAVIGTLTLPIDYEVCIDWTYGTYNETTLIQNNIANLAPLVLAFGVQRVIMLSPMQITLDQN